MCLFLFVITGAITPQSDLRRTHNLTEPPYEFLVPPLRSNEKRLLLEALATDCWVARRSYGAGRSSERYWIASLTWRASIGPPPSRSAAVRATFRMRV